MRGAVHCDVSRVVLSVPPAGTLIRRHRIALPAPDDGRFYTVEDFNVGREITLYGRVFSLVVSPGPTAWAECDYASL